MRIVNQQNEKTINKEKVDGLIKKIVYSIPKNVKIFFDKFLIVLFLFFYFLYIYFELKKGNNRTKIIIDKLYIHKTKFIERFDEQDKKIVQLDEDNTVFLQKVAKLEKSGKENSFTFAKRLNNSKLVINKKINQFENYIDLQKEINLSKERNFNKIEKDFFKTLKKLEEKTVFLENKIKYIKKISQHIINENQKEFRINYIDYITDNIYLGDRRCIENKECLIYYNISHIVSFDGGNNFEKLNISYFRIYLTDSVGEIIFPIFEIGLQYIYHLRKKFNNDRILIQCYNGKSRSASLIIYYLMVTKKISYFQAYDFVKLRRPIVSPNREFESQLLELENNKSTCKAKNFFEFNSNIYFNSLS